MAPPPTDSAGAFSAALEDVTRRRLLFHLAHHGTSTVDDLVEVLVATSRHEDESTRRALVASLYHVHLPKLDRLGIASWDRDVDAVALAVDPDRLDAWLAVALAEDVTDATATAPPRDDDGLDVLYVEDYRTLADLVASRFARDHPDVALTIATSVADALDHVEREPFDCIVSDYDMPGMTGIDFLRAIRDVDPDVPFVLYTGMGNEAVASEAVTHGATDYLQKRTDDAGFDVLAERIRRAVDDD